VWSMKRPLHALIENTDAECPEQRLFVCGKRTVAGLALLVDKQKGCASAQPFCLS
jgi:hypothetical protein